MPNSTALVALSPAVAQLVPTPAVERHAKKALAVGNISLIDSWKPTSTTGGLYQVSFRKWTVTRTTNPDSVVATLSTSLAAKLANGTVHADIRLALRNDFFLNIAPDASLRESNGGWILTNGRDRYELVLTADALQVATGISEQVIHLPRYYLHLLAGVSFNGDDDYALTGQIGAIKRNASGTFTAIGVAAQGTLPIKGVAPVLRLEVLDVIALQGGPAYYEGGQWGYYLSVDFMKGLWEDVGLK